MALSNEKLNVQTSSGVKTISLYDTMAEGLSNANQSVSSTCLAVKTNSGILYAATNESPSSPNAAILQVRDASNNVRYVHPNGVFDKTIYVPATNICSAINSTRTPVGPGPLYGSDTGIESTWYIESIHPIDTTLLSFSEIANPAGCFYYEYVSDIYWREASTPLPGITAPSKSAGYYLVVSYQEMYITQKFAKQLYNAGHYKSSPFGRPLDTRYLNSKYRYVPVINQYTNNAYGIECVVKQ